MCKLVCLDIFSRFASLRACCLFQLGNLPPPPFVFGRELRGELRGELGGIGLPAWRVALLVNAVVVSALRRNRGEDFGDRFGDRGGRGEGDRLRLSVPSGSIDINISVLESGSCLAELVLLPSIDACGACDAGAWLSMSSLVIV